MSGVDFILVGALVLLSFGGIVHFLVVRTQFERVAHQQKDVWSALTLVKEQPGLADVSAEMVELHRKLTMLATTQENQELRLTDIADSLDHRFNRLRMRQARAAKEEEEEGPELDPEAAEQLLMDLNGAQVPEAEEQPRRGRLVRKSRRDGYGRR